MQDSLIRADYYKVKPDWLFKKTLKENRMLIGELSKLTGIHRNYISMYTMGRYVLDAFERRRITKALGLPENEVFDRNDVHSLK